jgi:hypothetical protein
MIAFYIIEYLKQNGVKGIEKPKNYAEILKQKREEKIRI